MPAKASENHIFSLLFFEAPTSTENDSNPTANEILPLHVAIDDHVFLDVCLSFTVEAGHESASIKLDPFTVPSSPQTGGLGKPGTLLHRLLKYSVPV